MTATDVKNLIKNFIKNNLPEVKDIVTFGFPMFFPAVIIDEPTSTIEWVGFGVYKEKYDLKVTIIAPSGINRDDSIDTIQKIQNKFNLLLLQNPSLNSQVTEIKVLEVEPSKLILKETDEQAVEYIGAILNISLYNLIAGG